MELKNFQKKVISDLKSYLSLLNEELDIIKAYNRFWVDKQVAVGRGGVREYNSILPGVPHVCFKVPTGGGKTFIACNSIKPIFDSLPVTKAKAVVWLVPSDSILTQTLSCLKSPDHPYRQQLDLDFGGRVEVYTKQQLLNGQNFNPTSIREQLSLFVLSFDSLRITKKDTRKLYQQNSSLVPFTKVMPSEGPFIEGADESSLIQIIAQLSPAVIVDESHNAQSDLSIQMLKDLNPSFVVDLTATPRDNSNIISFVDALQLKNENMVKLPVIVYNRKNQMDVIQEAIYMQKRLEILAKEENKQFGTYIRPIVLFQAQSNTDDGNTTFSKLKEKLIKANIPANEIAIKTSAINELKDIDLMSPTCPIKYIITVNALKEGWDCPFAYILATLANRSSAVDVEQILGRVLRQPYARTHTGAFLNMSYVLTSSESFKDTLSSIVTGLNNAGFSGNDYRVAENDFETTQIDNDKFIQSEIGPVKDAGTDGDNTDEWVEINPSELNAAINRFDSALEKGDLPANGSEDVFDAASKQLVAYQTAANAGGLPIADAPALEIREKMNMFRMNPAFVDQAIELEIPQFYLRTEPSLLLPETSTLLTKEHLTDGFTLRDKDTMIDFNNVNDDLYMVDLDKSGEAVPKYSKLSPLSTKQFKEYFSALPAQQRLEYFRQMILRFVKPINTIEDSELQEYVYRITQGMTADQIANIEGSVNAYAEKIKIKIDALLDKHRENTFTSWLAGKQVSCKQSYRLKPIISPLRNIAGITKSLYTAEEDMGDAEHKLILAIAGLDNVVWWHRNISKTGFFINGYINQYPDFIVMTDKGRIVLVESKGDHLNNEDSRQKVILGHEWQALAGDKHQYFMVFDDYEMNKLGAVTQDAFMRAMRML